MSLFQLEKTGNLSQFLDTESNSKKLNHETITKSQYIYWAHLINSNSSILDLQVVTTNHQLKMFKLLFLIVLIKSVVTIPYANNYPYKTIGFSNAASEIAGNGDTNRFLKNELTDHGNNIKSAQDNGKFYDSENISKLHDLNHLNKGTSSDIQKHSTGENFENDNSHNRKHIKSGFKNSYHKDESGNNSSFYEDSDDRGEKTIYNKRLGARDDIKDNRFSEGVRDGAARDKYDDRRGGFLSKGTHDRQHLLAENQGKSKNLN